MTLVNFAPRPVVRTRKPQNVQPAFFRSSPLVNILELDELFQIQLAIPGVSKDQIKLDVKDDQLFIEGVESSDDDSNLGNKFLRKEYDFTGFKKVFNLTEEINQEAIDASLVDGVLTITLNKKDEAKAIPPRSITIK